MPAHPYAPWSRPWSATTTSSVQVPPWWPMGGSGFGHFCDEIVAALDELFGPVSIDPLGGWATVEIAGEEAHVSLANLAQACAGVPEQAWRQEIRRGLREIEEACRMVAAVEMGDPERVRQWLRVKVVRTVDLHTASPPPCAIPIADDLSAVVLVDLTVCRWPLAAEIVDGWGADPGDVARAAAGATAAALLQPGATVTPGAPTALVGRDASACIAAPDAIVPAATRSCLIAVPNGDLALVLALGDATATADQIDQLETMAVQAHGQWPDPVSPHLYRWTSTGGARLFTP